MSAKSPSEIKCEKPMPFDRAQSRTAVHKAPDCDTNAILPGNAAMCAKLAFRPTPGTNKPRQFGPKILNPYGRATSNNACCRLGPLSVDAEDSPADRTTTARVPRIASSATIPGTEGAGVQMTAISGAMGRLATSRYASTPPIAEYLGLTGNTGPANPPCSKFRITTAPTLFRRFDAPMTATDLG